MSRFLPILCAVLLATALPAAGLAAAAPPATHLHRVPCALTAPDTLTISWRIDAAGGVDPLSAGHRTFHRQSAVMPLYRDICGHTLDDRPFVCACLAIRYSGVYHLAFRRGRASLLRITERAEGFIWLTVDGHPKLGSDRLGCLILPPGVPSTPEAHAVRPGHWSCLGR